MKLTMTTQTTVMKSKSRIPLIRRRLLPLNPRGRVDWRSILSVSNRHYALCSLVAPPADFLHFIGTAVTFIAFLLSFSTHITITLVASFVAFLAALITLIAFAIDIALFALVKHAINGLDIGAKTDVAPGFWLTFASLILLLLGGCTVCFGRRRERLSSASTSYPMKTTGRGRFWAKITGKSRA